MQPILEITLTPTGPGVYRAEGRDARGKPVACHTFRYRPDLLTVHGQFKALEEGATTLGDDDAAPTPALLAQAEDFGRDLYAALFGGERAARWDALRAQAQAAGHPARLRLRFAPDAPELAALPWEFLHDGQGFLAPDRGLLLSRGAANLPDLPTPPTESGPLHVLVVVSNPLDLPDHQAFEPDDELDVIYRALDEPLRRGQIQVEVVDEASPGEMQQAFIARDYRVVHFIGHGDFDEARGGYLVVEDEAGDAAPLSGERFAGLLAGRGVRLVLLSSCLTARSSPTRAYRGVAGALLQRGLPAVVAMQYPILVTAARAFYRTVYRALAANRPLGVAVAEGRQALYLERGGASLDWATPALLSRGAGGWRLGVDARSAQAAPPAPQVELASLGELELMDRGFVGRQREQRQIRRAFVRDEARAALIHGFGGIGKTVLATRLARRLGETERFDGVFGLRARPDLRAGEVLRAFNDARPRRFRPGAAQPAAPGPQGGRPGPDFAPGAPGDSFRQLRGLAGPRRGQPALARSEGPPPGRLAGRADQRPGPGQQNSVHQPLPFRPPAAGAAGRRAADPAPGRVEPGRGAAPDGPPARPAPDRL